MYRRQVRTIERWNSAFLDANLTTLTLLLSITILANMFGLNVRIFSQGHMHNRTEGSSTTLNIAHINNNHYDSLQPIYCMLH